MATITFNGDIGTPSKGFNLKIDVTYEQSIANNKTTITRAKGYVKRNNSTYTQFRHTQFLLCKHIDKDGNYKPQKCTGKAVYYMHRIFGHDAFFPGYRQSCGKAVPSAPFVQCKG